LNPYPWLTKTEDDVRRRKKRQKNREAEED
jgi:hypothetical protein